SATITDPGTLDTFTLKVNWGDGSVTTQALPAGTTAFSVQHRYLDDNPTGTASDTYAIGFTLTDDDGGSATAGLATAELVTNGGFETGDFTGWTVSSTPGSAWHINNGTFDPEGPATPLAPIAGSFDAVFSQTGGSTGLLSEAFVVPTNVVSATLSWSDR